MIKVLCDACGKTITRVVYPHEMRHPTHFCNKECRLEYDKRTGHFKRMSLAGKAGRSRVMPRSNKEKPRRKRQAAIWL